MGGRGRGSVSSQGIFTTPQIGANWGLGRSQLPKRANLNNSLATCDTGCVSLIVVVLYIETIYYVGLDVSRLSKID